MAKPVQSLFHPGLGFTFVHRVASTAQRPQMLATVPEIQKLSRLGPAVGLEIPDPSNPITQHQLLLRTAQTSPDRFPMQPTPQLHRVALAAYHRFVGDHCPASLSSARLLVQVKYSVLYFVPLHALLLGFLLSPTRSPKARKPSVEHQQSQFRGSTLWLTLLRHLLEPFLGLHLRLAPHSLH